MIRVAFVAVKEEGFRGGRADYCYVRSMLEGAYFEPADGGIVTAEGQINS